jgi:hypothetical protein
MSSVGSQMRRENEKILEEHIQKFMQEATSHLKASEVVYLHAPGLNRFFFLAELERLGMSSKIRAVQFANKKASSSEGTELVQKISALKLILK